MKKIIEIFKNDFRKLRNNSVAIIIIIGIIIIPGIYAWLNIDSNWGPYDNTGNIPIAIVNNDKGVKLFDEKINIGNEIEDSLKKNNGMKWIFTDKKDAKKKVKQGKYYGAIIIPENFSNQITTIFDGNEIKKPKFDFYINDKKNPIAPIIVNKAIGTIENSVNQSFVNTTIYKTLEKTEQLDLISKEAEVSNKLIDKLENTKKDIKKLKKILKTTDLAGSTTSSSLLAVKQILPNITDITNTTKDGILDIKNAATTFDSNYANLEKELESSIDEFISIANDIKTLINQTNEINYEENFNKINEKLDALLTRLKRFNNTLIAINNTFSLPGVQNLEKKVANQISKIEELQEIIKKAKYDIQILEDIKKRSDNLLSNITSIKNDYDNSVHDELNKVYMGASKAINDASNVMLNVNGSLDNVDSSIKYIIDALNSGSELIGNIDTVLDDFIIDIDNLILQIREIKQGEVYNNFIRLLKNNPNDLADFLSSPVEAREIDLYQVKTYGSKMTPFYSVLACWVGCTILTALLKTNIKESKITADAKNYQKFLGRFIIFALIAMAQGLVIGLGDLILQVQTANWLLFLITLVLTSLVFIFIIYSLTQAFGKIGQALSIVLLVLQVAGSGGTFPIELLPRLFQILQPYMPFYPAMNAVRETIGGFYQLDYIKYILLLLCHIIIPLLLGLVFSKYTSNIKTKIENELEQTDLIG